MATNYYDSGDRAEQKNDLRPGFVWSILSKDVGTNFNGCRTPVELSKHDWTIAPITTKLGFPLQISGKRAGAEGKGQPFHIQAQMFFLDADLDSPDFGDQRGLAEHWQDDLFFTRTDGRDIENWQVHSLMQYVQAEVMPPSVDVAKAKKKGDQQEMDRLKDILAKRLRPEAFHAFFEEHCRLSSINGAPCKDVESPLRVTLGDQEIAPVCGSCYSSENKQGGALVKCARCGGRFYCDKACQKVDWKTHKTVCKRPA